MQLHLFNKSRRRLMAIMFVDLVGFTAMTADNEEASLTLLDDVISGLRQKVQKYNGHWLKQVGDGSLATFDSTLDAIGCALDIQQCCEALGQHKLRIGVHIGDVVSKDGDIWGDGVNVASRIQGLAPVGGICISQMVDDALAGYAIQREPMLNKDIKGIKRDLKLFLVNANQPIPKTRTRIKWPPLTAAITILAVLMFVGWKWQEQEPFSDDSSDAPLSIAVLPLDDFSENRQLGYVANGLAEEMLNVLARIPALHVASRTASFALQTQGKTIEGIADELGVRYLIEGSVRNTQTGLRITVQLIDSENNRHLYSDIFDGSLEDTVLLQERISFATAKAVANIADKDFSAYLVRSPNAVNNPDAYLVYLQGKALLDQYDTTGAIEQAEAKFHQAMQLVPDYPRANAGLCRLYAIRYKHLAENDTALYTKAWQHCQQALKHDPNWLEVQVALANLYFSGGQLDKAEALTESLSEVFPYHDDINLLRVDLLTARQDYGQATLSLQTLLKQSPADVRLWNKLATIRLYQGQWQQAIEPLARALELTPGNPLLISNLGTSYFYLGNLEQAKKLYQQALELHQEVWLMINLGNIAYFEHQFELALEHYEQALKHNDSDHELFASIADCYIQLQQTQLAEQHYQNALRLAKGQQFISPTAELESMILYYLARLGNFEPVRSGLEQFYNNKDMPSDSYYFLARAAHLVGARDLENHFKKRAVESQYPAFLLELEPTFNEQPLLVKESL